MMIINGCDDLSHLEKIGICKSIITVITVISLMEFSFFCKFKRVGKSGLQLFPKVKYA